MSDEELMKILDSIGDGTKFMGDYDLEAENAKLRELLKRCRSYVDYEIMEILDRGGVPVDHVRLIEEIDQVIGRWREGG
jgi:hypothetical protein